MTQRAVWNLAAYKELPSCYQHNHAIFYCKGFGAHVMGRQGTQTGIADSRWNSRGHLSCGHLSWGFSLRLPAGGLTAENRGEPREGPWGATGRAAAGRCGVIRWHSMTPPWEPAQSNGNSCTTTRHKTGIQQHRCDVMPRTNARMASVDGD